MPSSIDSFLLDYIVLFMGILKSYPVLVYDETAGISIAYVDYASQKWVSRTQGTTAELSNVIAWCPLPPIPQVVNSQNE